MEMKDSKIHSVKTNSGYGGALYIVISDDNITDCSTNMTTFDNPIYLD
jgi:hypothetical protein